MNEKSSARRDIISIWKGVSDSLSEQKQIDVDLYKMQIIDDCCDEWVVPGGFEKWLYSEMKLSAGRTLIRFDESKPYSPENCMLSGKIYVLKKPLFEKYHIDPDRTYNYIKNHYGKDAIQEAWPTVRHFIKWVQHYDKPIPYRAAFRRYDPKKPYSPENAYFTVSKKEYDYKVPRDIRAIYRAIDKIKEETGEDYKARYFALKSRKSIDPNEWDYISYLNFIKANYDAGILKKGMHMNKIDRSKPFSENNVYFSYRQNGNTKHGMSYTKLYHKWSSFVSYYKNELKCSIPFEDFMNDAIYKKRYLPDKVLSVKRGNGEISLENVSFKDIGIYTDLNRICTIYRNIPDDENDFDDLLDFVNWSILSGYNEYTDFRKVKDGAYSKNTCVWDIFDTEKKKTHSKKIACLTVMSKKNCSYMKQKWYNIKNIAGVCEEWKDFSVFEKWFSENKVDRNCRLIRKDKTLPYSPENVIIMRSERRAA